MKKNFEMIKEISLINFYSFDNEIVSLQSDSNILIGINGSGKSNFLKAIKLLKEGVAGKGLKKYVLDDIGGFDNAFFKGVNRTDKSQSITLRFLLDGLAITKGGYGFRFTDDIDYQITFNKTPGLSNYYIRELLTNIKGFTYLDFTGGVGQLTEKIKAEGYKTRLIKYDDYDPQELVLSEVSDTDRYFALTTIKKAIRDIVVYEYFDTTSKSLIRKPMLPTSEKRLLSEGTNLPQILNTIKINHKQAHHKIIESLNDVNASYTGLDFNFIGGSIELMLEERQLNSAIHVSGISDGTLRYLCLLSILYNPERGRFICIDEPEVGLHPDMILNIANAIKEAAKDSTIIISTHSQNLLNYFDIENVRVFEKDNNNATHIVTYTKDKFAGWYDTFSLGQMWKEGDLGGVRYGG